MRTIDRLQHWLSLCERQPSLARLVTPARRLGIVIQHRVHARWPAIPKLPTSDFAAVFSAATMMRVECRLHPRNWELPLPTSAFALRTRWFALCDRQFDGLYGGAWAATFFMRQQRDAEVGLLSITLGVSIERLLYGKNGASGALGFAGVIGGTVAEMSQRLALGTTELFVVSAEASEELHEEAQELNRRIFQGT